jgi:hypothetical protein
MKYVSSAFYIFLVFMMTSSTIAIAAKKTHVCALKLANFKKEHLTVAWPRIRVSGEFLDLVRELLPGIELQKFSDHDGGWDWSRKSEVVSFTSSDGLRLALIGDALAFTRFPHNRVSEVTLPRLREPIILVASSISKISIDGPGESVVVDAIKFEFKYKNMFLYYYYCIDPNYMSRYWTFKKAGSSFEHRFLEVYGGGGGWG